MTPQLSVIVTTSGREDRVQRQLASVAALRAECSGELVIATGGSRRAIELAIADAELAPWETLLLPMESSTAARARQLASTRASGEVLVFVDDDTILQPGALAAHLAAHATAPGGVVVGNTRWADGAAASQFQHWFAHRRFRPHLWEPGGIVPAGEADPGHWSVSRQTLAPFSFDEKIALAGLETRDLFARMAAAGVKFRFAIGALASASGLPATEDAYLRAHRRGEACRALGSVVLSDPWSTAARGAGRARPRWVLKARRLCGMPDGPFEWAAREGHAFLLGLAGKPLAEDVLGKGYPGVG